MEAIPDCEEVTICNETVHPGWIYCESSKKYVPNSDDGSIEIKESVQYKVGCCTGETLQLLRDHKVFQNSSWVKDLHSFDSNSVIRVIGTKTLSRKVNNVECHGKPVITSVKNDARTMMLIICSQNINTEIVTDLQRVLEHTLNGSNKPDIMFKLNFIFDHAFIYSKLGKLTVEATLEKIIENFCSCVTKSTVSMYVSTAIVMKPKLNYLQEVNYHKGKLEDTNTMEARKEKESISGSKQPSSKLLIETKVTGDESNIPQEVLQGDTRTTRSHTEATYFSVDCASHLKGKFNSTSEFDDQKITFTAHLKINTKLCAHEHCRKKYLLENNCKYPHKEGSNRVEGCSGKLRGHIEKERFASSYSESTDVHCKHNMDPQISATIDRCMAQNISQLIPKPESSSTMSVADCILEDCKVAISKGNEHVISDQTSLGAKQKIPCTNLSSDNKKTLPDRQLTSTTEMKRGSISEECSSSVKSMRGRYSKSPSQHVGLCGRILQRPTTAVDCDYISHKDKNCIDEGSSSSQSKKKLAKDLPTTTITEHPLADLTPFEATKMIKFWDLKPAEVLTEEPGYRRKCFGIKSPQKQEKVILLIGGEGSGKTTLINFLANFLKSVKIEDKEIFLVEKTHNKKDSDTMAMTAYTFCFTEGDTPITLIDTPGLNDDTGMEARNNITLLKTFLAREDIQLHAIGYVISSNSVRLAASECQILEFFVTQFGQGISKNFITFVTFSDIQGTPPVVDILKEYNVKGNLVLKFNNSIFNMKECQMDDIDKAFWKTGVKSWKKCLKFLEGLPPLTINSFKAKQSQTFLSSQMNSVEMKLRKELKNYMLLFKDSKKLTKEVQESAEQVWGLASVLYHLKSKNESSVSDIESVLVSIADEAAKDIPFPSKDCVMLLSLCPSRGALETGKRVIECLAPIYAKAKESSVLKDFPVKKKPSVLYCMKCRAHHELNRQDRITGKGKPKADQVNHMISYKCQKCNCDEKSHVDAVSQTRSMNDFSLALSDCINHLKEIIEKILCKCSLPGHSINMNLYLELLDAALDYRYKDLFQAMLKCY